MPWDEKAIDEFYKGCMPKFLLDDTLLVADDKLRLYEVKMFEVNALCFLYFLGGICSSYAVCMLLCFTGSGAGHT